MTPIKVLRLRSNPWRLDETKHSPLTNGTYGDTRFYIDQTSYLNMQILNFAKDVDIIFFKTIANLGYGCHLSEHTSFILTYSSGTLYKGYC